MRHHETLQFILEKINTTNHIYSTSKLTEDFKSVCDGELRNFLEELIEFKYIESDTDFTPPVVMGYRMKELGKTFLKEGGFIKKFEDKEFKDTVEKKLLIFNYDVRWVIFYIAFGGTLIGLISLVKSCIDDKENKSEIRKLQIELKEVKASVDSLPCRQKAD